MAGGPRKGKVKVKVAKFLTKWIDMIIDGHRVSRWLQPDAGDPAKATCLLCPSPNSLSINEVWKAVTQDNSCAKHQQNMESPMKNPEFKQVDNCTPKITDGLKMMMELQKQKNVNKEAILVFQINS